MLNSALQQSFLFMRRKCWRKSIHLIISSGYSTNQEINRVEIIGTIYKHLYTAPSGYKSYLIQTVEPGNKFYYHLTGTIMKDDCKNGNRVHLTGRISSQNVWTEQGKLAQKIILKCGDFELLDNLDTRSDLNHAQLFAQISSEITNTRDYSAFSMSTKHIPKNWEKNGMFVREHHRILVREASMLDMVRNQLKKGDWISIDGKICYTFRKNAENKLRQSGYILANRLSNVHTKEHR